jgi:hypothetical protein
MMGTVVTFSVAEAMPERAAFLASQGVSEGRPASRAMEASFEQAKQLFSVGAAPRGLVTEISQGDFAEVYQGDGRNASRTPVGEIFPQAERLALFAATIGAKVGEEIQRCFQQGDFATAFLLDALASTAADRLGELLEAWFRGQLSEGRGDAASVCVVRYSPGYCGWDISGQRKLFDYLRPEEIGITLRESFLMEPLKSVSGVLIPGPRNIHEFTMGYASCNCCEARTCRERIRALGGGPA